MGKWSCSAHVALVEHMLTDVRLHTWIDLHFADDSPWGFARVHTHTNGSHTPVRQLGKRACISSLLNHDSGSKDQSNLLRRGLMSARIAADAFVAEAAAAVAAALCLQ